MIVVELRTRVVRNRLEPRRVVDVGDGGDRGPHLVDPRAQVGTALVVVRVVDPQFGSHVGDEQHVRRLDAGLDVEVLARLVVEHLGRERSERLAVLDLEVHDRLHGGRARIADDRTVAERAGPELHPSLQEPHHVAVGDRTGDALGTRRAGEALVGVAALVEPRRHFVAAEPGTEVRALHPIVHAVGFARVVEDLVPAVQRGADGAAGVAGRGLDPEVLERPLAQQDTIRDAVERDSTGETHVRSPVVSAASRAIVSTMSSVTTWIDAARSSSRRVISDSGARGGPPNRSAKRRFVIVSPER